ncbi:DUF4189 domain-containing protein [Lysobacter sp.]|uniref:DUF4189 domain-containing protein n=1 Tax=Lysobacter sp. TaxID=72226 RepID=UPI0039C8E493
MKSRALALVLLTVATGSALAEGGCPAGQYPYDTPQARQCVPIPGKSGSGDVPPTRWLDRWGALAVDPATGDMGVSAGEHSQSAARQLAVERCSANGSSGCAVESTFHNQCAAIARGGGRRATATAATEKEAQERAMQKLTRCTSEAKCAVAWSDCSLPVRVQ